jgi:glycosyltransferase involved in cell wall biosynthesis
VRYSIVTPTILRPSLLRLCASIAKQTEKDWEHLIVVDSPYEQLTPEQFDVFKVVAQSDRAVYLKTTFSFCNKRHNNYGHTCRHNAWELVKGEYIFYVDDDDYFAYEGVLTALNLVTKPWAIFPVMHYGSYFFNDPPGMCKTGTGMFIHKPFTGHWPDSDEYEADGRFIEKLKETYEYDSLVSVPVMVIQEKASKGL